MHKIYTLDIDTYIEIVELAKKHGKKPGDNMQEEFDEVSKKNKDKIKFIGNTQYDKDMLAGNLREEGIKIINLDELIRKENHHEFE